MPVPRHTRSIQQSLWCLRPVQHALHGDQLFELDMCFVHPLGQDAGYGRAQTWLDRLIFVLMFVSGSFVDCRFVINARTKVSSSYHDTC